MLAAAVGCDDANQAAAPPDGANGADEVIAAFAATYVDMELPVAIVEGSWDSIADPALSAALKRYAEENGVYRTLPPQEPQWGWGEEYVRLARMNAALPEWRFHFGPMSAGEVSVGISRRGCRFAEGMFAEVTSDGVGGWKVGPVKLRFPPGHPDLDLLTAAERAASHERLTRLRPDWNWRHPDECFSRLRVDLEEETVR
jgi:hypothetical protein